MKKLSIILCLLLALILLAACDNGKQKYSLQKTECFFDIDAEYVTGVSLYDFVFGYSKECGNDEQDYIKWISDKLNSLEYSEKEVLSKDEVGVINAGGGPRWQVYVASMYPKDDGQYESKTASCYFTTNTIIVEHTDGGQTVYTLTEDSINTLQEILSVLPDTNIAESFTSEYTNLSAPEKVTLIHAKIGYNKENDITITEITDKEEISSLFEGLKFENLSLSNSFCR